MISICIPSRGPTIGIWATIAGMTCALEYAGKKFEFCVLINGKELDEYTENLLNKVGAHWEHKTEAIPYPQARNHVARMAQGKIIIFSDDHCIPAYNFFDLLDLNRADVLHATYHPFVESYRYYHQFLTPEFKRGEYSITPASSLPYYVATANQGLLAVRKEAWLKIGGYWEGFPGYGQDECWLDLKAWEVGCKVMLDPRLRYWHFSVRKRDYDRPRSDEITGPPLDLGLIRARLEEYGAVR